MSLERTGGTQLETDQEAPFTLVLSGGDATARKRLAEKYAARGQTAVAEFFHRSILVAEKLAWRQWTSDTSSDPCGTVAPLQVRPESAVIEQLEHEGRYDDAIAEVRRASANGDECHWRVQWADLTRLKAMVEPDAIAAVDQENAVGILITAAQANQLPLGAVGRASVFISLAQYFGTRGDRISAMTAYLVARDLVDEPDVPDAVRSDLRQAINRSIDRLRP